MNGLLVSFSCLWVRMLCHWPCVICVLTAWCVPLCRVARLTLRKGTSTCRLMSTVSAFSARWSTRASSTWLRRTSSSRSPWVSPEVRHTLAPWWPTRTIPADMHALNLFTLGGAVSDNISVAVRETFCQKMHSGSNWGSPFNIFDFSLDLHQVKYWIIWHECHDESYMINAQSCWQYESGHQKCIAVFLHIFLCICNAHLAKSNNFHFMLINIPKVRGIGQ